MRFRIIVIRCFLRACWSSSGDRIDEVVDAFKAEGDANVGAFDVNVADGASACEGHPDVTKSRAMGEKLAAEIRRVLGW